MYTYYAVTHVLKSVYTLVTGNQNAAARAPTMGAGRPRWLIADFIDHRPAPNDADGRFASAQVSLLDKGFLGVSFN
jgi:hypothetical protein